MPDNRNTDNPSEHLPLDIEDWEIALEPYEGNPGSRVAHGRPGYWSTQKLSQRS